MFMVWTNEEVQIIKDNYRTMTDEELVGLFINRSKSSIESKRKSMNLIRSKYKKYSYDDVLDEFSKHENYKLLSIKDEYLDCNSKMRYVCNLHKDMGEQSITLNHLQTGRGCYYCGRDISGLKRRIVLDKKYDEKLCKSKNFTYIDTFRTENKITIKFICNKHVDLGEQSMTKNNMERNIKGCKYCSGKQLPEWYVMKMINQINPYIKLLEPYKNLTNSMNCLCLKHNYNTRKTVQQILKGQGCTLCGKEKLSELSFLNDDEVQRRINTLNPHVKLIKYMGNKKQSIFCCKKHNKTFKKFYYTLLQNNSGCDDCYIENVRERSSLSIDEFKERLNTIHPELIVIGEYINNSTPIKVYCTKHNYEYYSSPTTLLDRKTCCDKIRITYKEEQVCKLLEEKWGFKITRQKTFDDCIDKRCLPFDVYLNDFNILIEYQGEQHYYPIKYSSETLEEADNKFAYTKNHDKIKEGYCFNKNIPLIEIPYWEYDDLEYFLFDKLSKLGAIKEVKNTAQSPVFNNQ